MKSLFPFCIPFIFRVSMLLTACALVSCELPPREAWSIIQRDGLLTYWSREYNPRFAPSRYLASDHRPFIPTSAPRVPYRTRTEHSRYLAEAPGTPYRAVSPAPKVTVRPEPPPPPRIPLEPSVTATLPKSKPANDSPPAQPVGVDLPYGTPVPGRPGMVNSPFAEKQQLVDVTGMAPGEAVKDPYTGKLFRVPPAIQAAAEKTEPEPAAATNEGIKTQP